VERPYAKRLGVRQLAAAFEGGSKLPHSKALRATYCRNTGAWKMKPLLFVLTLCLLFCAGSNAVDDPATLASVQQRIARLQSDIERAEAIRAVKRLQRAYGHYAEFGLWNDLSDLFSGTGVDIYPPGNGKEGIGKPFLQDIGKGSLGLHDGVLYPHIMLQPVVTLEPDGKSAKGRWRVFAMLGVYGETAIWAGGVYENEYVLENGVWKIKGLHYYSQYSGRYDQPGWTTDKEAIPIHYDPRRAGTLILGMNNTPASKEAPRSIALLSAGLNVLLRRAQRLSDQSDVENLQHSYGYYVDRKMWDDVADLFTSDGTMELGQQGVYAGKKSIRRALNQFGPAGLSEGELNDHLQLQCIVDIGPDGLTARARGVELIMAGKNGVSGEWREGIFENTYTKQKGVWRIKSMQVYTRLITDYDKGWAKDGRPAPGPSTQFPPDQPPTNAYATYPTFCIPPFHYGNPVTSRPTQYPEANAKEPVKSSPKAQRPAEGPRPPIAQSLEELQAKADETERLLKVAVAYDAAENLVSAYGYYIDDFMWDETADLFARDGWKELSYVGTYVGRERIRQSLKIRYPGGKPKGSFTAHQITQPVIHVAPDGQSAKIRVRLFQLGGVSGGNGLWLGGIYENKAILEDKVWKISAMDLDYVYTADSKGGWAHAAGTFSAPKVPMTSPFPPDRPLRGVVVAPFPKVVDLPFHYTNPVTGRKPPLFLP
jgi:hypothetical protein